MAKPFGNISLTERLAASSYNSLPNQQKKVEQGSVQLILPKEVEQGESPILRRLITSRISNSSTLILQPYSPEPPSELAIPDNKTVFRKVISLKNRLEQSKLGTTNHLPQFFLSDTFAGYIKIKQFGQQEHTSTVDIFPFSFEPRRDGKSPIAPTLEINGGLGLINTFQGDKISPVNLQVPSQEVLSRQGVLLINGVYTNSVVNLDQPIQDIILQQGVVREQNQYVSIINVETPLTSVLELQGVVVNGGNFVSLIDPQQPSTPESIERGGVEPTEPTTPQSIGILQGLAEAGISVVSINPVPQYTNFVELHGAAVLTTTTFQQDIVDAINQGGEQPRIFTFRPEVQAPILQTLGYSADRLLALTAPRIKHGSASLLPPKFGRPEENQTLLLKTDYTKRPFGVAPGTPQISGEGDSKQSWLTLPTWYYYSGDDRQGKLKSPQDAPTIVGGRDRILDPSGQADALTASRIVGRVPGFVAGQKWRNTVSPSETLATYRALSYGEIAERGSPSAARVSTSPILTNGSTTFKGLTDVDNNSDFVDLIIEGIRFRAYITSFSDSYNVNWNDVNYMGRPDTLKAYKGTTRSISLSFKTAAFTKSDLTAMYQKLESLIKKTALGTPAGSFLQGPLTNLTVGNWVVNTPCVVNSLKLDTNPLEYSWDVGDPRPRGTTTIPSAEGLDGDANSKQMPMIVDVSLDLSVLGDNSGAQMLAGGNYINLV